MGLLTNRRGIKANVYDFMIFVIIFLLVLMLVFTLAGWRMVEIIHKPAQRIGDDTAGKARDNMAWNGVKKSTGFIKLPMGGLPFA